MPCFPLWSQLDAPFNALHTHSIPSLKEASLHFPLCQQDPAHSVSTQFLSTSPVPGPVSGNTERLSPSLREQQSGCAEGHRLAESCFLCWHLSITILPMIWSYRNGIVFLDQQYESHLPLEFMRPRQPGRAFLVLMPATLLSVAQPTQKVKV